jgi:hypothetical protein
VDVKNETAEIQKVDWRVNRVTWTTSPMPLVSGKILPPGASVTDPAFVKIGKQRVGISIPNATAMFLNLSCGCHKAAGELVHRCLSMKDAHGHLPYDLVPEFFEQMMSAIVFACTALEAFVNEQIPDDFVYSGSKKIARTSMTRLRSSVT